VGERQVVLDSNGRPVATIELTAIDVVRMAEVGLWLVRKRGKKVTSQ
jgi:uncharacterized protein YhfF